MSLDCSCRDKSKVSLAARWLVLAVFALAACGGDDAGGGAGSGATAGTAGVGGTAGSAGMAGVGGDDAAVPDAGERDATADDAAMTDQDAGETTDAGADAAIDAGPTLLINGSTCVDGAACESGACVDGVCCASACDGACEACASALTGVADGTCAPISEATDPDNECEASACMAGTCNGTGACAPIPDGTECRAASGDCDMAETCVAGECPSDVMREAGTECRAAEGICDVAEQCDGVSSACPSNAFVEAGVICRGTGQPCDLNETCSGVDAECPADVRAPEGTMCRASQGPCDLTETCDGSSVLCPADAKSTAVCRTSAGTCDVAEVCNGTDNECPTNAFQPDSSNVCGSAFCTGSSAMCVACRTSNDCTQGDVCDQNVCVTPKRIFSTSTTHNGNLGGLAGADAICQARAQAANLTGTYKAWLSSSSVSASSRLTHATVPYVMPNGTRIADNWTDLTDGRLLVGITTTETGTYVPNNRPWTHTNNNGDGAGGSPCVNWTSSATTETALAGQSFSVVSWTAVIYNSCNTMARLYCLEQ